MTNSPPGADYDSSAPWYTTQEIQEKEYEPEDEVDDSEPGDDEGLQFDEH